jgi:hypothetical protein
MNGGHYTAFVRLDSGTDIDFDEIHTSPGAIHSGADKVLLSSLFLTPDPLIVSQSDTPLQYSSRLHQSLSAHGPGGTSASPSKDKWLFFDDDFVEEIPVDRVVSGEPASLPPHLSAHSPVPEQAYVLFYKRRRLTPSNIINMTI